jgi:UDPglucose 6-dehydrogenase
MKISIIGTGYVGLVTAACFAEVGNAVVCMDIDGGKIRLLGDGKVSFHEPGLSELVLANRQAGRLVFTTSYAEAVGHADILFIAVDTPSGEDGGADLSHVLEAVRGIGEHIARPIIIVNKSTAPVGTVERIRNAIAHLLRDRKMQVPFTVVSNPEFLKEGAAIADFMRPDRIVIGCDDENALKVLHDLYAPFNRYRDRLIATDVRSAELTKYAANAMLATRISFMNELADLAEAVGADIEAVRHGIGADPRIGPHFLYAGMGYGGSCFPKDIKALIKTAEQHGPTPRILAATEAVNEKQKMVMFGKLRDHYGGALRGKTIALWGLAFKPNTDDMRQAPSLVLIDQLLHAGALIRAYDPVAREEARRRLISAYGQARFNEAITLVDSAWETVSGADALVLVTEWKEFRSPDFVRLNTTLRDKTIFDGRNLYDPESVQAAGLRYYGIGRNNNAPPT